MTEVRVESAASPTTDHSSPVPLPLPASAELAAFFPQLEVLELIGHGGMGAVYAVRQIKLDRLAALKIIRPASATDSAFAERFLREARLLARLNHPNVVTVFDFGEVDHLCYIVMEHVNGESLRQRMRGGKLPPFEALAIARQICEALQFAHEAGIVHRDIKPENILLDKRCRVKLADFGLAKLAGDVRSPHTLTGTHQVMGTLRYMAPEQMEGARQVNHRADIYSLGVVIYEMLTGELPLGRFDPPSQHAPVDQRFDDVVIRLLAKDPAKRHQHVSDVLADFDAFDRAKRSDPMATTLAIATALNSASPLSVTNRLRGPAAANMLYGTLLSGAVFASFVYFVWFSLPRLAAEGIHTLHDTKDAFAMGLAIVLSITGIILWCGWNMLTLRSYRLSVLGGILSLPVGTWSLVVLSDPTVRAAFPPSNSSFRTSALFVRALIRRLPVRWLASALFGAIGIAASSMGWCWIDANYRYYPPKTWLVGLDWPHGKICCLSMSIGMLALTGKIAIKSKSRWPIWIRGGASAFAALAGVVFAVQFGLAKVLPGLYIQVGAALIFLVLAAGELYSLKRPTSLEATPVEPTSLQTAP